MGINAGTYSCGVTYGNGTAESMSEATWLIDDFGKLLQIVSK
jgi:phosphoglycolate phosphatase